MFSPEQLDCVDAQAYMTFGTRWKNPTSGETTQCHCLSAVVKIDYPCPFPGLCPLYLPLSLIMK